ncbi:MAG: HD domain-containing protein [Bacilli bacterium]
MTAMRSPAPPFDHRRAAFAMMRQYQTDIAHCERVEAYAQQLFAWVYAEAADESDHWLRLSLAALLHDIGRCIADRGHHRHSRYLVASARQTEAWPALLRSDVAMLVFAHRKPAKRTWLNSYFDNRPALFQLAAILRVADGLDREHAGTARLLSGMHCQGQFQLSVSGVSEPAAKHLAEKKADAWRWAFGQPLVLNTRATQ